MRKFPPIAVWILLSASWLSLVGAQGWVAEAAGATGKTDPPTTATKAAPSDFRPGRDPLFRHQWYLRALQVPSAWAVSRGAGVTVAVLDTGVAYENRGRYRRAPDLAGTRFAAGWDFVDDDPHPNDVPPAGGLRSHGTHIAGVIAQTAGNGIGGAGVAPAATIMPVRVLRPDRSGSARNIARGLRFAADHGADVANLSIAGPSPARPLKEAIDYATANGVTVVAAAGNEGRPSVSWPAAYPKVLAVGAVDRKLARSRYSNYGRALDLVAPAGAGDIPDTEYGPADGVPAQTLKGSPSRFCFCFMASTSAAAAQVSGVAALLVASGRAEMPADVRPALTSAARDLGPEGRDPEYGAGLVRARSALSDARAGSAGAAAPAGDSGTASGDSESDVSPAVSIGGAGLAGLIALLFLARRRRGQSA